MNNQPVIIPEKCPRCNNLMSAGGILESKGVYACSFCPYEIPLNTKPQSWAEKRRLKLQDEKNRKFSQTREGLKITREMTQIYHLERIAIALETIAQAFLQTPTTGQEEIPQEIEETKEEKEEPKVEKKNKKK